MAMCSSLPAGCSSKGASRNEYLLSGVARAPTDISILEAEVAQSPEPAISVGPVDLPSYLRRSEIVTRIDGSQVRASQNHVWAEELARSVGRAVMSNLMVLIPTTQVSLFPSLAASTADYRVAIHVQEFAAALDGTAVLDAVWRLTKADVSDVVVGRRTRIDRSVDGKGHSAVVAAMNAMLADLSVEIAEEIRTARSAGR
jgi:uncharacterized lipoprotein YmbA